MLGDPEVQRKWINFDVLVTATEQEEAEQIDDGNAEKAPGD